MSEKTVPDNILQNVEVPFPKCEKCDQFIYPGEDGIGYFIHANELCEKRDLRDSNENYLKIYGGFVPELKNVYGFYMVFGKETFNCAFQVENEFNLKEIAEIALTQFAKKLREQL